MNMIENKELELFTLKLEMSRLFLSDVKTERNNNVDDVYNSRQQIH